MFGRIGDWYQRRNRLHKAKWIAAFIEANEIGSVLLVGVGGRPRNDWEALIETAVDNSAERVVWSGLWEGEPGNRLDVVADALNLPFVDASFDLVYSNAVIEHVGDAAAQQHFIAEHQRVGRCWAATTPNRWFPIESHTRVLVLHWISSWRRGRTEFTRLLSRREFRELGTQVEGALFSPTFTDWGASLRDSLPSNTVVAKPGIEPRLATGTDSSVLAHRTGTALLSDSPGDT